MDKNKGYLLPSGDAYTEDMACTLVYYPDKPEYRRALGGSLAYLATWIAWEKESERKGRDAALSWKIALELTMECWQMACLEQLQDDVSEILEIMKLPPNCCEETDVSGGDQFTDRVTDGVGDVPQNVIDAGYAADAADWAGFDDYKCMISHVIVDQLYARLLELAPYVTTAALVVGGLATISAIITTLFTGGLTAIAFGLVASTGAVALLYQGIVSGDLLEILAAKVTTNHDELACAVYGSDGDVGALVALNDKIDELFTAVEALILKNMNLGPTLKALYAGRYDQQDIADVLLNAGYELGDFDCTCIIPVGEYFYTQDWPELDNWETWTHNTGDLMIAGRTSFAVRLRYGNPNGFAYLQVGDLITAVGLINYPNRKIAVHRFSAWRKAEAAHVAIPRLGTRTNSTGAPWQWNTFSNVKVWTESVKTWDSPGRQMDYNGTFGLESAGAAGGYGQFDDVIIDFDTWLE